ncbi:MAG: tetratricopeptide repeat protein, partial [Aquificae bacterium]|nr:tetratricopeptide repeat protein [Aquificota bacterium]
IKLFLKKKVAVAAYNTKKYKYAFMLMKDINEPIFKLYAAYALLKLGDIQEAEKYFKQAYELSSEKEIKEKALKYLADIYYFSNEDRKLLEVVKKLSKINEDYAKNLLGWFFFKKKLYDKALISFTDPYMKAVSAFNSGDLDTALHIIKTLNDRKSKFLLTYIYTKKGDIQNARAVLEELSQGEDDIARKAMYMYAYSFFSQGDFERAIIEFQKLIDKFPNTKEADRALLKMANAYFNIGEREKAREMYQEYINKHANTPEAIDAAYQLALLEMKSGGKNTIKQIESFIKKYPDYPFINLLIVQLADAYVQNKNFKKAEALYKKIIEKNTEESEYALYRLAYMKFKYGRKGEAIVLLRKYLKKYPHGKYTIQVRDLLAQAFESFGKTGDAIAVLKKLPKTPENQLKLATLLFKNGDYTEAKSYFESLYNRFPKMRNDIAYYLGKIQYELGYFQNALKYLNEAIRGSDYHHIAESYYLIGLIYKQQGKKEEALNNIINVIYLYPEAKNIVVKARVEAAKLMKDLGRRYEASCILKPVLKEEQIPRYLKKEALKLKKKLPECVE